jgi:hypothetical protein
MLTTLALIFLLPAGPVSAQEVPASTAPLTMGQVYASSGLRDPLLPATVYGDSKGGAKGAGGAASAAVVPGTFSVYNLAITGIMEDSGGRQALLRDTATGALYSLKAGKLRDAKRKTVPGVTGVVKDRQVVLMTEDKKIHQVSLPEKE